MERTSPPYKEPPMVADQRGLLLSLVLLLLAFVVGMSFRSYFSNEKIKYWAEQAIRGSSVPGLHVELGHVQLSLANGLAPEVALVADHLSLKSEDPCYFSPEILIEGLRIPLRLSALMGGEVALSQAKVSRLEFAAREIGGNCQKFRPAKTLNPTPKPQNNEAPKAVADAPSAELSQAQGRGGGMADWEQDRWALPWNSLPRGAVESVQIRNFVLRWPGMEKYELQINDVEMTKNNQDLSGRGQLHIRLAPGEKAGLPPIVGELVFEAPVPGKASLSLRGNWREGLFRLKGSWDIRQSQLQFAGNLSHFPILGFLEAADIHTAPGKRDPAKNLWLTTGVAGRSATAQGADSQLVFDNLKIEGDLASVEIPELVLNYDGRFQLAPWSAQISQLDLTSTIRYLGGELPKSLASAGWLEGQFDYLNDEKLAFSGQLENLETIFSNRGQRQLQNLAARTLQISKLGPAVDVKVSGILLGDHEAGGEILYRSPDELKTGYLEADLSQIQLSRAVAELMTGGGSIAALDLTGQLDITGPELTGGQALIQSTQIQLPHYEFIDPRVQVQLGGDNFEYRVSSEALILKPESKVYPLLTQILGPASALHNSSELRLSTIEVRLEGGPGSSLSWSKTEAQLPGEGLLKSQGRLDLAGQLSGQLTLQKSGQTERTWSIEGPAQAPVLR